MPNAGPQTVRVATPRNSGLKLMEHVNAMYQSGFIGSDTKTQLTNLILTGMNTGDYTELSGIIAEQCPRASSENPFWNQMREFLNEEAQE